MKKHIYIAFLFCIVSLTGCDNFLTVESPDFSTDKFWWHHIKKTKSPVNQ